MPAVSLLEGGYRERNSAALVIAGDHPDPSATTGTQEVAQLTAP
jgi:hypothetical protein